MSTQRHEPEFKRRCQAQRWRMGKSTGHPTVFGNRALRDGLPRPNTSTSSPKVRMTRASRQTGVGLETQALEVAFVDDMDGSEALV